MSSDQTYTVLETKLNESLSEQNDIQSIDIEKLMQESKIIKELSDALSDTIDDEPFTYSNS